MSSRFPPAPIPLPGNLGRLPGHVVRGEMRHPAPDSITAEEVRIFLRTYRKIMGQPGMDSCRSVPLEIFLGLVASDHMIMTEEEIATIVDASRDSVRRWLKVLVDQEVLNESDSATHKLYALAPRCLERYLFSI